MGDDALASESRASGHHGRRRANHATPAISASARSAWTRSDSTRRRTSAAHLAPSVEVADRTRADLTARRPRMLAVGRQPTALQRRRRRMPSWPRTATRRLDCALPALPWTHVVSSSRARCAPSTRRCEDSRVSIAEAGRSRRPASPAVGVVSSPSDLARRRPWSFRICSAAGDARGWRAREPGHHARRVRGARDLVRTAAVGMLRVGIARAERAIRGLGRAAQSALTGRQEGGPGGRALRRRVIGGGHNGLVSAAYLARAGLQDARPGAPPRPGRRRRHRGDRSRASASRSRRTSSACCGRRSSGSCELPRHGLDILPLDGTFTPLRRATADGRRLPVARQRPRPDRPRAASLVDAATPRRTRSTAS